MPLPLSAVTTQLVIAAVLTYELISMIIEKNNMHDIDTFMFFKWAFKSAAAAIIVNHTFDFIMAVFQVAQTMVQRSAGVIDTNASIDISSAIANITTELQATGLGDLFALMLETWVVCGQRICAGTVTAQRPLCG